MPSKIYLIGSFFLGLFVVEPHLYSMYPAAPHNNLTCTEVSLDELPDALQWLIKMANFPLENILEWGAEHNNLIAIKYALERGALITHRTREGDTLLHIAVERGFVELIKWLLFQSNVSWAEVKYVNGLTPLHSAAITNHLDILKLLHDFDFNINANTYRNKRTALQMAAFSGAVLTVEFLLNNNADVNFRDTEGNTALHHAVLGNANLEILERLIEFGANVDEPNVKEETALHLAILEGSFYAIKYFVEHGANINIPDCEGNTPLHLAIQKGYVEIVKYLLENKANIDAKNKLGQTAFYLAVKCNNKAIFQLINNKRNENKTVVLYYRKRNLPMPPEKDWYKDLVSQGLDSPTETNGRAFVSSPTSG